MERAKHLRAGVLCVVLCGSLLCMFCGEPKEKLEVVAVAAQTEPADTEGMTDSLLLETVQLDVEPILQMPELPNGCEVTSLATVLQYYGFSVTKEELAANYLPYELFAFEGLDIIAPDPNEAYAGDPFGMSCAFYCFAPPIVEAANAYFADVGAHYVALDATGASIDELIGYLMEGRPVIIWATLHFEPPEYVANFQ